MTSNEVVKKVNSLIQLDIDAVHAYQQAIEHIDVTDVKNQLVQFKHDHENHVQNLSEVVRKLGGQPPEFSRDFKGFVIQGFTALRSVTGTEGALKAMKSNEELTNSSYDDALSWDVTTEVRNVIQKNRDDEKRHLRYIEQCIENCVWEQREQKSKVA